MVSPSSLGRFVFDHFLAGSNLGYRQVLFFTVYSTLPIPFSLWFLSTTFQSITPGMSSLAEILEVTSLTKQSISFTFIWAKSLSFYSRVANFNREKGTHWL
mmetsp:Transcript_25108/g.35784  ORF Transcript_25108/g.35784 Transcript_25108/m.35784 type:complete len:101 (+) Transcript_25108:286-588(+)